MEPVPAECPSPSSSSMRPAARETQEHQLDKLAELLRELSNKQSQMYVMVHEKLDEIARSVRNAGRPPWGRAE